MSPISWSTPVLHVTGDVLTASDWNIGSNDLTWLADGVMLGSTQYAPVSLATYSTTTSLSVVDGTNLTVSFVAPPSGKVIFSASIYAGVSIVSDLALAPLESGSLPATAQACRVMGPWSSGPEYEGYVSSRTVVSGLTSGSSHTYALGAYESSGTAASLYAQVSGGANPGPAVLTVQASP